MKRLIFTDLDGTFLNHDSYDFNDAKEAIETIKALKIPLIFTTSKTKAEVERLQKKVGIHEPFIVENGAALFIPMRYQGFDFPFLRDDKEKKVLMFGQPYHIILEFYSAYKERFGMRGFSDMSEEEICEYTGLSQPDTFLAKQRDFTEPFLLEDETQLSQLQKIAHDCELKITQGGRFYHLMGKSQDKGIAVEETIDLFKRLYQDSIHTLALGDSQNDVEMLASVEWPIVIQKPDGSYLDIALPNLHRSSYPGSKGWNEMVLRYV